MKLEIILDRLEYLSNELKNELNGSNEDLYIKNSHGTCTYEGVFTPYGEMIISDDYVYVEIKPDKIPKNINIRLRYGKLRIEYDDVEKDIVFPFKVKKIERIYTNNGIIDIKIKR